MLIPAFIAGDWGTSHLRLTLCDAGGRALDRRFGPGVAQLRSDCRTVLAASTADWAAQHGPLPVVLCGMVGSSIGWVNVPYLACAVAPEQVASSAARLEDGRVAIVPGLSCRNVNGAPDVLRGEETQVLGALRLEAGLGRGRHLLCLPGTHTKWLVLDEGVIGEFLSAVTGELFALIREHSVLVRADQPPQSGDGPAFEQAVAHVRQHSEATILQTLFECRTRQLNGEFSAQAASAYLSGLLIATDVNAAERAFAALLSANRPVSLIGAPELTDLYAAAFAARGLETAAIDGTSASLAGLASICARIFPEAHVGAH